MAGQIGRPRTWAKQRRQSGVGFYRETSSLCYPTDKGMERRYVYFDKFKGKYMEVLKGDKMKVGQQELISDLKDILNKAKQIQIQREKSFISQLKSVNIIADFNESELFQGQSGNMSINYSNQKVVNEYLTFLSKVLVSENVKETLTKIITVSVVQKAFQKAIEEVASAHPVEFFTTISTSQEGSLTDKLQTLTWKYIMDEVRKSPIFLKSEIDIEKIKTINPGIQSALEGLGKVSRTSKNKVMQILKDENKDKKQVFGKVNMPGLNNNMTGAIGEVINYLGLVLGAEGKKFGSSTKSIGSDYGKTDLFTEINFPEITGSSKSIMRSISFSVKSSSLADGEGFSRPAKLADQSSLSTRYEQIRNFLPQKDTKSLNELFFNINNQLANKMTVSQNKSIVEILGFASINWMFKDIIAEEQDAESGKDLNFYIINGQIIPVSMIFEFMQVQIEEIGNHPEGIGRASFKAPSPTVGDYYYKEGDYQERIDKMWRENSRSTVWDEMRDHVEDKAKLGFYLNTARIKQMLKVENIKG